MAAPPELQRRTLRYEKRRPIAFTKDRIEYGLICYERFKIIVSITDAPHSLQKHDRRTLINSGWRFVLIDSKKVISDPRGVMEKIVLCLCSQRSPQIHRDRVRAAFPGITGSNS